MKYKIQERRLLSDLFRDGVVSLFKKHRVIVAGGAVVSVFNNTEINDYDVYCKSTDDVIALKEDLLVNGFVLKSDTVNAFTFIKVSGDHRLVVQLIKYDKFCLESVDDTFKSFDFYCCMGAYDFEKSEFILHDRFLIDNLEKKLIFNPLSEYPICTLHRVLKYQKRGYSISGSEIVKLSLCIQGLVLNDYRDLRDQLQGIDTIQLMPITDLLMKTPKEKYDKDKIFKFFKDYDLDDSEL